MSHTFFLVCSRYMITFVYIQPPSRRVATGEFLTCSQFWPNISRFCGTQEKIGGTSRQHATLMCAYNGVKPSKGVQMHRWWGVGGGVQGTCCIVQLEPSSAFVTAHVRFLCFSNYRGWIRFHAGKLLRSSEYHFFYLSVKYPPSFFPSSNDCRNQSLFFVMKKQSALCFLCNLVGETTEIDGRIWCTDTAHFLVRWIKPKHSFRFVAKEFSVSTDTGASNTKFEIVIFVWLFNLVIFKFRVKLSKLT